MEKRAHEEEAVLTSSSTRDWIRLNWGKPLKRQRYGAAAMASGVREVNSELDLLRCYGMLI